MVPIRGRLTMTGNNIPPDLICTNEAHEARFHHYYLLLQGYFQKLFQEYKSRDYSHLAPLEGSLGDLPMELLVYLLDDSSYRMLPRAREYQQGVAVQPRARGARLRTSAFRQPTSERGNQRATRLYWEAYLPRQLHASLDTEHTD